LGLLRLYKLDHVAILRHIRHARHLQSSRPPLPHLSCQNISICLWRAWKDMTRRAKHRLFCGVSPASALQLRSICRLKLASPSICSDVFTLLMPYGLAANGALNGRRGLARFAHSMLAGGNHKTMLPRRTTERRKKAAWRGGGVPPAPSACLGDMLPAYLRHRQAVASDAEEAAAPSRAPCGEEGSGGGRRRRDGVEGVRERKEKRKEGRAERDFHATTTIRRGCPATLPVPPSLLFCLSYALPHVSIPLLFSPGHTL